MKVIDEERIIEDMKRYAPNTQYDAHDYSRYGNEIRLEFLIQDALGLIYSLQEENRKLLEKSNDLRDELIGATCDLGNAKELIEQQKEEIKRFNDMKFTQEHCDLYSENEWLKDMLRQYMNGEIVNEDVFCQQVEDMRQLRRYTAEQYHDMMNKVIEKLDYVEKIKEAFQL